MDGAIEVWRDAPNCTGFRVSNLGRVIGRRGKPVRGSACKDGYIWIAVCESGRTKRVSVHSMVAAAFIGPRPPRHDIDHLDRRRTNNAASNLRYCTHAENMSGADAGGHTTNRRRLSDDDVRAIRQSTDRTCVLAVRYGVSDSTISLTRSGQRWGRLLPSTAEHSEAHAQPNPSIRTTP